MKISKGASAEKKAKRFLSSYGLKLVAANYHCKIGEIDLIMSEVDTLVFIEVRFRSRASHGTAAESITRQKQKNIIGTAQHFLLHHPEWQQAPCRFDVLAATNSDFQFQWIKDAFTL